MEQGTRRRRRPELDQLPPAKRAHKSPRRGYVVSDRDAEKCVLGDGAVGGSSDPVRFGSAACNKAHLTRKSARLG